jgi:hypothetical protein
MRTSRGRAHHEYMDAIAIVIAVVCFALLALGIEALDRV